MSQPVTMISARDASASENHIKEHTNINIKVRGQQREGQFRDFQCIAMWACVSGVKKNLNNLLNMKYGNKLPNPLI